MADQQYIPLQNIQTKLEREYFTQKAYQALYNILNTGGTVEAISLAQHYFWTIFCEDSFFLQLFNDVDKKTARKKLILLFINKLSEETLKEKIINIMRYKTKSLKSFFNTPVTQILKIIDKNPELVLLQVLANEDLEYHFYLLKNIITNNLSNVFLDLLRIAMVDNQLGKKIAKLLEVFLQQSDHNCRFYFSEKKSLVQFIPNNFLEVRITPLTIKQEMDESQSLEKRPRCALHINNDPLEQILKNVSKLNYNRSNKHSFLPYKRVDKQKIKNECVSGAKRNFGKHFSN